MSATRRTAWPALMAGAVLLIAAGTARANVALTQLSTDPFTNSGSQHATEVEPDTYSFGSTIVSAFQVGRFSDGGASDIGWATSIDSGSTWSHGFLPGLTQWEGGGSFQRVSDASVAYDAAHGVWMISSIPITSSVTVPSVVVSRSTDGLTWSNPVTVTTFADAALDKNWTVCDDGATSPFYGHCYTEFDDNGDLNRIYMSTSTDGGLTWGTPQRTANNATGIGGQPVVQPNGTVVVPIDNANETSLLSFTSTNGGASWSATTTITSIRSHTEAGNLRSGPLPSAEIDGSGVVYVTWSDCRFRSGCKSNDLVFSTSGNGTSWSTVTRVPIDATNSAVDHFVPGLAVDKSTSGASAHLGLTYYYYPVSKCSASTCQLDVGFVSSPDGGASWTAPTQLAGPMNLSWLPSTTQGVMVGDYISTSYAAGTAHGSFEVAFAPSGGVFNQATYTPASGLLRSLTPSAGTGTLTPAGLDRPVPGARSDHPAPAAPLTSH
ncbi:exo-alpha-sialidase [Actinocrinis puniceicyclus]|uniref:Exo-alpha-sialidase n=1 Tax=Actinocrinis puniceicyclus TaxID=977794 RepID=A0A8J8BF41_9ACTN|nr:sialidase family protein [Actinocrinis puniceicyclus]MBS2966250.1 exo-alpha-sialidase [Actinocrinis puniceicyclus]